MDGYLMAECRGGAAAESAEEQGLQIGGGESEDAAAGERTMRRAAGERTVRTEESTIVSPDACCCTFICGSDVPEMPLRFE